MRKLLLLILLIPSISSAEVTTNITLTSDYIWRGITQTNHEAAVQGTFEYSKNGFALGTWLSSLDQSSGSGTEVDWYGSYTHKLSDDLSLGLGATKYSYSGNHSVDTLEYFLNASSKYVNLFIGSTGDYFGTESASMYYNLSKSFDCKESNLIINVSLGYTTFDKEELAGNRSTMDYKLGIGRSVDGFDYELFFTDTDRKQYDGTTETEVDDVAIGMSLTKAI